MTLSGVQGRADRKLCFTLTACINTQVCRLSTWAKTPFSLLCLKVVLMLLEVALVSHPAKLAWSGQFPFLQNDQQM